MADIKNEQKTAEELECEADALLEEDEKRNSLDDIEAAPEDEESLLSDPDVLERDFDDEPTEDELKLEEVDLDNLDDDVALENMSLDIDMLVENVYRDRMDRASFYKKFVTFGLILYMMIALVQIMLGDTYQQMLGLWYVQLLLHLVVVINTYFLLMGTKFYNEDVGAE